MVRGPMSKRSAPSKPPARAKRLRSAAPLDLGSIRKRNPDLDDEQCPRACLSALPKHSGLLQQTDRWTADAPPLRMIDHVVDMLCEPAANAPESEDLLDRLSSEQVPLSALQLYSTDSSAEMLAAALYGGFFPFGSEFKYPGRALANRGLLNMELGGPEGLDPVEYPDLPGGRIILDLSRGSDQLIVGKRSLKTVQAVDGGSGFAYSLTCNTVFEDSWARVVEEHGIDWVGFTNIQQAYHELHHCYNNLTAEHTKTPPSMPRVVSIELWDDQTQLVSAEIGCIVGRCYVCLSLFARVDEYPRCEQVRAQAAILWLQKAGVRLFDAGTTAQYFCRLFGFHRVSRAEFKSSWRAHRQSQLENPGVLLGRCSDVRGLLEQRTEPVAALSATDTASSKKHPIRVCGLPSEVTRVDLEAAFAGCGVVKKASVFEALGFGVVLFATAAAVDAALCLDGTAIQFDQAGSAVVEIARGPSRQREKNRGCPSRRTRAVAFTKKSRRKPKKRKQQKGSDESSIKRKRVKRCANSEEVAMSQCIAWKQQLKGFVSYKAK